MSTWVKFYGATAQEAEQKAKDYASKLDFMQQPTVSKAVEATNAYLLDTASKGPENKWVVTVQYWGLD